MAVIADNPNPEIDGELKRALGPWHLISLASAASSARASSCSPAMPPPVTPAPAW